MSSQVDDLWAAAQRLRSHEISSEAIEMIAEVLTPEETPHEILVGVTGSTSFSVEPQTHVNESNVETAVLTDRRILFFKEQDRSEITLYDVQSIIVSDGMSLAKISFYTRGSQRAIQQVSAVDAQRFAEVAKNTLHLPVSIGTSTITDSQAQRELQELDALKAAGLITEPEWAQLRRPILRNLGLQDNAVTTTAATPQKDNTVRNAALIITVSLIALLSGAVLMYFALSGDDPEPQPEPVPAETQEAAPEPAPTATVTETQTPPPTPEEGEDEEEEEATTEEGEEEPEETESPSPSPSPEDEGDYSDTSAAELNQMVFDYFEDIGEEPMYALNTTEELITLVVDPYPGSDRASAVDVSADLAILLTEDNDVIEDPVHSTTVAVGIEEQPGDPEDRETEIVVRFDRESGQYVQSAE